jgi:hypothetical protein
MVIIEPQMSVKPVCSSEESVTVAVKQMIELMAAQVEVVYDPTIIEIIDANPNKDGIQVSIGNAFSDGFVAKNEVDIVNGRIIFATALLEGNTVEGDLDLIHIGWRPLSVGTTGLSLENVMLISLGGQTIDHTHQHGTVEIIADCDSNVSGFAKLQGRHDYSGIMITTATGQQTQTLADGSFSIAGGDLLNFQFPGYLSAQTKVQVGVELAQVHSQSGIQPTSLGSITLLAGDVNSDEVIDIFDLVYIAGRFGADDSLADLNASGTVDIVDLAMAANNYDQQGPLTNWQ